MPAAAIMPDRPLANEDPGVPAKPDKPRGCAGRFWQYFAAQRTKGHTVSQDLRFSVATLAVITVGLLAGGAVLLAIPLSKVETRVRYSDAGPLATLTADQRAIVIQNRTMEPGFANMALPQLPILTTAQIQIDKDMPAPVYVYYVLRSFYQNHKRFVRSVDYAQLHGKSSSASKECDPQSKLNGETINPCGLQAYSTFNDTFDNFVVASANGEVSSVEVDSSDLVWQTDRDFLFANYTPQNVNTNIDTRGGRELDKNVDQDEHLMEWLRPFAKPDVVKFWGVIRRDLKQGEVLQVEVTHAYNTYNFDGAKEIMLTTQSKFGGRNFVFGIFWLAGGVVSLIALIAYIARGGRQLRSRQARVEWLQQRWDEGDM